jgi:hypothetical protein
MIDVETTKGFLPGLFYFVFDINSPSIYDTFVGSNLKSNLGWAFPKQLVKLIF